MSRVVFGMVLCGMTVTIGQCSFHDDHRRFLAEHWNSDGLKNLMFQPPTCVGLPSTTNGQYKCPAAPHREGQVCDLTCSVGYSLSGSPVSSTCHLGRWSNTASCTVVRCPDPPTVSNGVYYCGDSHHQVGDTCSLQCNDGYLPSRSSTDIHCLSDSSWSNIAACKGIKTDTTQNQPAMSQIGVILASAMTKAASKAVATTSAESSTVQKSHVASSSVPSVSTSTTSTSKPKTSTTLSTSTTTAAIVSPQDCEVCSGPLCGLIPGHVAMTTCPPDKPYCLNHVENDVSGGKTVSKSCASADECNRRWWHETSDKSSCVDFDPTIIYKYQLSCSYCCTKPGCNKDIVPEKHTLFIGHD